MRLCRLCSTPATILFKDSRSFYFCGTCGLIFTDCPLTNEDKIKHYQSQFDNDFNWKAEAKGFEPLFHKNSGDYRIFDYGSGSGKLGSALRDLGYDVDCYEPMFDGEFTSRNLYGKYDFIILNEVIEHIENLKSVLTDIHYLLGSNGRALIKTFLTDEIINDPSNASDIFANWWYKNDMTHISFFSLITFEYICNRLFPDLKIIFHNRFSVVLASSNTG